MTNHKWILGLLVLLWAGIGLFYFINLSGSLMHDDEGTDFYEVWQVSEGRKPGIDFIAEQQPLFLLVGSTIIRFFGRSALPLRLLATIQVLMGMVLLSVTVYQLWGCRPAFLTLILIVTSGLIYEQARLFRPDPLMFAWEMVGLAATLIALYKNDRKFWLFAGLAYGGAFLWKPFAVFPIIGLYLFFLDWLIFERYRLRDVFVNILIFSISFLLIGVGVSVLLYREYGFYYLAVASQHAQLGHESSFLIHVSRPAIGMFQFLLVNSVFFFIVPLWIMNKPQKWSQRLDLRFLFWQMFTPLIFILISRPFYVRYLVYLIPVLAIILAWQVELMFIKLEQQSSNISVIVPIIIGLILLFSSLTTFPRLCGLMSSKELRTMALADYVADHTNQEDLVLSDYAGINFFAERRSIYEASIIAGGRIQGGIITGSLLIDRIEEDDVQMVLIHTEGGIPHQLVKLIDYEEFRGYLAEEFELMTIFNRNGQQIEVHKRLQ